MSEKWLTPSLWTMALRLYKELEKKGESIGRYKLKDALQITESQARLLVAMLENRDTIRLKLNEFHTARKELVISDLHIPYHDDVAVEVALNCAEKEQVDTIVILGDLIDFYQISSFVKNPKKKSVEQEIKETKKFLEELRARFKDARIIYLEGNHSLRMQRYLWKKAPEIYALIENLLPNMLTLKDLNIEYLQDPFRIGKLWHLHGHEKQGKGNPKYITHVFMSIILDHFICGHFHRNQEAIFRRIDGSELYAGVIGMLAKNEELEYAKINNWTQGFAIIDYNNKGYFRCKIYPVKDGEVYR